MPFLTDDGGSAMAHKPAGRIYRMLKFGTDYADKGIETMNPDTGNRKMNLLTRQAPALNLRLFPSSEITR